MTEPVAPPTDCPGCGTIPQEQHTDDGLLPEPVAALEWYSGGAFQLRRCPVCGAWFDWFFDHDSGGGHEAGYTYESIRRLSDAEAIDRLRDALHVLPSDPAPILEADLERLLGEHPEPVAPVSTLLAVLEEEARVGPHDGDKEPARRAAWTLGRLRAEEALPALVRGLGRPALRSVAARALARFGALAVPALVARLASEDAYERIAAASGLGLVGAAASGARGPLLASLSAPFPESEGLHRARAASAWALGHIGFGDEGVGPLLQLFGGLTWERDAAIDALARRGADVVPALLDALRHPHWVVVAAAVRTLEAIGPGAVAAVPALEALVAAAPPGRPRTTVPAGAARALAAILRP